MTHPTRDEAAKRIHLNRIDALAHELARALEIGWRMHGIEVEEVRYARNRYAYDVEWQYFVKLHVEAGPKPK